MEDVEIDAKVAELFQLSNTERALVSDFFIFTLEDFKIGAQSKGRKSIPVPQVADRLATYLEWLVGTLRQGFGADKPITSTIYIAPKESEFPYCIVSMELGAGGDAVKVRDLSVEEARQLVMYLTEKNAARNIFYRKLLRVYILEKKAKGERVPTIYIIKPNEERYWTRSSAMRDGDEVAADLMQPAAFARR